MVPSQQQCILCRLYCLFTGVVVMESDQNGSWMDLVQRSWNLLAAKKAISDVEVQYVPVNRRTEFTMDMLIEGIYFVGRFKVLLQS